MDRELNPYKPGAGAKPPELVGRQREIDSFDLLVAMSRNGRAGRGMVLHGLRGVGKTVLLLTMSDLAERADWSVVHIEGRPGHSGAEAARKSLARSLVTTGRRLQRTKAAASAAADALRTISSFNVSVAGFEFGVEREVGRADSGNLEVDLEELVQDLIPALRKAGSVLAFFVDEMQDLDQEFLAALIAVQHRANQRDWPFYVFGAGLPSLPGALFRARSYAERLFDYRSIDRLDPVSARAAMLVPAERLGASFDSEAARLLLQEADGYPYFVQTFGQAAWDAAPDRTIDEPTARLAIVSGRASLDQGFYPARWERATPAERAYLRAMAVDGDGPSKTAELPARLGGRPAKTYSPNRQGLIDKGVIYSPARGLIAFSVPGMARYIRRHTDLDID